MADKSRMEELADGRHHRHLVPRSDHAVWEAPPGRADPLELLASQNADRMPELVPVRMKRMAQDPFAFLRGSVLVMARDIADAPVTGFTVQLCGDAHLANFGLYLSPEGELLFDVDDFDETDAGPWEFDLKRLCISAAVRRRVDGGSPQEQKTVAQAAAASYRTEMAKYAAMGEMELWLSRTDARVATGVFEEGVARRQARAQLRSASKRDDMAALPSLTALAPDGSRRIIDHPPLVSHDLVDNHRASVESAMAGYLSSLDDDRRSLVGRFEDVDFALKVVGVGSVGLGAFIALLLDETGRPLLLQIKQAVRSVLAQVGMSVPVPGRPHGPGAEGRRVVEGQRRMQASSDVFLGWADADGTDYYVRHLRDRRGTFNVGSGDVGQLSSYVGLCARALARAHARSAGAATAARIAGYLGASDAFDLSMGSFAVSYAEQCFRDHQALVDAIKAGAIQVK